jgi:hypothetical protein
MILASCFPGNPYPLIQWFFGSLIAEFSGVLFLSVSLVLVRFCIPFMHKCSSDMTSLSSSSHAFLSIILRMINQKLSCFAHADANWTPLAVRLILFMFTTTGAAQEIIECSQELATTVMNTSLDLL